MKQQKEIRYTLEASDAGSAESRLLNEYANGKHSKKALVAECLTAGYILKEAGLADMIAVLDTDPSFRTATGLEKRARILAMLTPQPIKADSEQFPRISAEQVKSATKEPEPQKPKAILPTLGN